MEQETFRTCIMVFLGSVLGVWPGAFIGAIVAFLTLATDARGEHNPINKAYAITFAFGAFTATIGGFIGYFL